MIVQWAELMDLRPSQAATAPVMIAAKLTPEAQAQAKAFLKDANLQEDMELHGMVSLYEKTYNGLARKVAEVDCKKCVRSWKKCWMRRKTGWRFPGKIWTVLRRRSFVWMNPGCMWPSLLWMIPW